MTKELKYMGPGNAKDPIQNIATAIVFVKGLNGHEPDDEEIREELVGYGLDATEENIAQVRAAVQEQSK
jgi:hypothetical protein